MKRNGLAIIIIAIAALALCITTIVVNASTMAYLGKPGETSDKCDSFESHLYPLTARVIGIYADSDIVLVDTATGISYKFYGIEDYECNDIVSMIMDDNGTESVYDDKIVEVRYSGFDYYRDMK